MMLKSKMALAAACVAAGFATSQASAAELRIGLIAPMTGSLAQIGKEMADGFQLYLDQHHGKLGGADVKLIVEDEQGKPDIAVVRAKKLILRDHVHLFVGGALASSGYALAPVSNAEKTLYIPTAAADDLTQRLLDKFPYIVRTSFASSQPSHALGQWACEQGYKKVVSIAADYAYGYEVLGGFQQAFESCGGKVIAKMWPPLGTKDFGPYIPNIQADADAIFTVAVGSMALQLPKQLRGAGIKKPILGANSSYDEELLPFMNDQMVGDISASQYSAAIDTPENSAFVKEYRAKYSKVPSYFAEQSYTTAMWIDEAMKKAGGEYPGPERFIELMHSVKLVAPRGAVSLDDMRNPIQNIYIKKVERKAMFGYTKQELWNTVIQTYPNVSQFWTYGKEAFLRQPVYGRDFPPCKFCE